MDNATIERFLRKSPFECFPPLPEDTARRRAHTLSNAEENCWQALRDGQRAIQCHGIFADADFPYPSVTLSDGKTVKLDWRFFRSTVLTLLRDCQVMDAFSPHWENIADLAP
jgi:hypothetical protein